MVVVRVLGPRWPGHTIAWLGRLAPWMPFCVRLHVGIALLWLAGVGRYLTPAMHLERDGAGYLLGALELVVACLLLIGWHTRPAAALLLVSGPIGLVQFGFSPIIQRIDMLGAALFVLFVGGGRWSADWERGDREEPSFTDAARGIWCLRVSAGLALVFAAFAEKLAYPAISVAFLDRYPRFNVLADLGLPVGALEFTRFAGVVEVLLGLLLISGAMPQLVMPVAAFPFVATLLALGSLELPGHLPAHAALIAFLVYSANPVLRPTVYQPWPWPVPRRRSRQPTTPPALR